MDQLNKKNRRERKNPRVPIKTYKWEDIRRARRRGGYPWTYLYKQPFDEKIDSAPFTMESLRKSKSASTLGTSESVEISEIVEPTKGSFNKFLEVPDKMETLDTLQIITEPDDHSIKNSTGSIVIEECEMSDNDSHKPEHVMLESADSSDNISQYLDREDRVPEKFDHLEDMHTTTGEEPNKTAVEENNTSINPQESKRKRRLSAESSRSKISFSKLAMIKKIKETKNKIKVPKLTFPTSKLKKPITKKNKNSPPETKKDIKKLNTQPKNVKPVYIHIPLKPPPGQTDEFSHLEFEEKSNTKPQQTKKLGSFRDIVKNVRQLQETKCDDVQNISNLATQLEIDGHSLQKDAPKLIEHDKSNKQNETDIEEKPIEDKSDLKTPLQENTIDDVRNEVLSEKGEAEELSELEDISSLGKQTNSIEIPAKNNAMTIESTLKSDRQYINERQNGTSKEKIISDFEEEKIDTTLMEEDDEEENANEMFDKLFESKASSSRDDDVETYKPKQVRSKSAEPERRRKLSLESSYSRKSLSKLGILKKLKETTDKIKNSLSRSNSKKQTKVEEAAIKKETKIQKKQKPEKPIKPVYIHIPLKPPEGQTDEFSYLEFEDKKPLQTEEHEETSSNPDSPIQTGGVQLIILTAPSDDEILDYHSSDVPETPSSENKVFFSNKIAELKELAKDVVDEISIPLNTLDTVKEETNSDKIKNEESNDTSEIKECEHTKPSNDHSHIEKEKMMVDEEDGLNETVTMQEIIPDPPLQAKDEINIEQPVGPKIKSNLKDESSPVIKKKVSFKRRSKTPKDGIYEDVQTSKPPTTDNEATDLNKSKSTILNINQSMSMDEEKTYLDEKIIKSTSLEEDYNKWSKISDHEYEPVNPPPDNETFPPSTPTVHIIDIDQEAKYVQPISEIDIVNNTGIVKNEISNEPPPAEFSITPASTTSTIIDEATQEPVSSSNKTKEGSNKFQLAFKQTTDQFKTKLHNIKKPHISMPDKSKFRKFKIEKPKFSFPKIPNTTKVNLPSFSLPRKSSEKRSLKERQLSTESNDGDSKKPIFDFSTYPRIFKKKTKPKVSSNEEVHPDFATVPRTAAKEKSGLNSETTVNWGDTDAIRIPLHAEEPVNVEYGEEEKETSRELHQQVDNNREDSVERRMTSHIRYEEDIDIDDEYERENQDINRDEYISRWDRGNFNSDPVDEYFKNYKNSKYKVTDLDSPEDIPGQNEDFKTNNNKETYSSGSSIAMQRVGGVLEEIDSDEFFLRQKGISQDNIEVGMLLSSEIREAFRMPDNALSKIQDAYSHDYNLRSSNQSLPESQNKRKPIKKPKRKKTPHTSQEQIPYAEESADEDLDILPPSRPKRRSKRVKKSKNVDDIIPYQETISLDVNNIDTRLLQHRESLGILGDDEREFEADITYENEVMQGRQQPEIKIIDAYKNFKFDNKKQNDDNLNDEDNFVQKPEAPPRKQKSLRSLNLSENDSVSGDINKDVWELEIEQNRVNTESSMPTSEDPPRRPSRMRSHTSSQSIIVPQLDDDSLSKRTESLTSENQIPCVEEPCIQDIRDYMGYAIVDKNKVRDPPLPPPRTPVRRKRSAKSTTSLSSDSKSFTVPRPHKGADAPIRPLRNYSTLGQSRKVNDTVTYENKENIDIMQYIEIDDESNRDLQSGDIIKKMKDRPLPAPPRPPRKSRALRDISSKENIMSESHNDIDEKSGLQESEVSTQTEPLPDDFVCEDVISEVSDTIISPSNISKSENDIVDPRDNQPEEISFVERRLITPTYFTHEETITHGSLVVQPLDGNKILPDSEITSTSKERIIPITTDTDSETSSIPEEFKKFKSPSQDIKSNTSTDPQTEHNISPEVNILKTQKLQVSDLDVDTLTVNKLLAGRIVVSEIDSSNIQTNEISSKSGALKIGDLELPSGIINQILKSITSTENPSSSNEETTHCLKTVEDSFREQKKTPINNPPESNQTVQSAHMLSESEKDLVEIEPCTDNPLDYNYLQSSEHLTDSGEIIEDSLNKPPQPPTRSSHLEDSEENVEILIADQNVDEFPQRPPRQSEKIKRDSNFSNTDTIQEPDIDDEPPPRPPAPQLDYLPSQPPASFYALRAQNYIDTFGDNIPVVPRRRRQPKSKPISRSSSEESEATPISRRFYSRSSEPSIPHLSGQLVRACGTAANNALKRLITHITSTVLQNSDGKQDLHVMVIILLVLIAGLILLGYGDEKTVVHLHHWEYFNPPKDM